MAADSSTPPLLYISFYSLSPPRFWVVREDSFPFSFLFSSLCCCKDSRRHAFSSHSQKEVNRSSLAWCSLSMREREREREKRAPQGECHCACIFYPSMMRRSPTSYVDIGLENIEVEDVQSGDDD